MSEKQETAKIKIIVPKGCTRESLSIDALDKHTRDLAYSTFIYVDGKPLLCRSFKTKMTGGERIVILEVREECFEIVEEDLNANNLEKESVS